MNNQNKPKKKEFKPLFDVIDILCNNCYKRLTKEEKKGKSVNRLYRGDNYCFKCQKLFNLAENNETDDETGSDGE